MIARIAKSLGLGVIALSLCQCQSGVTVTQAEAEVIKADMSQITPKLHIDPFTVMEVKDGDTLVIATNNTGKQKELRLKGMEAPDIKQPGGEDARHFLEAISLGRIIAVKDGEITLSDGMNVSEVVVDEGYGWATGPKPEKKDPDKQSLFDFEDAAREAGRGIWDKQNPEDPDPVPPWEWRKQNEQHGVITVACANCSEELPADRLKAGTDIGKCKKCKTPVYLPNEISVESAVIPGLAEPPPAKEDSQSHPKVYVQDKVSVYHTKPYRECRADHPDSPWHQISLSEALKQQYTPCAKCVQEMAVEIEGKGHSDAP